MCLQYNTYCLVTATNANKCLKIFMSINLHCWINELHLWKYDSGSIKLFRKPISNKIKKYCTLKLSVSLYGVTLHFKRLLSCFVNFIIYIYSKII